MLHLKFSRIQFTPDLMPADIVGTNIVQEHSHGGTFFEFQPGPDLRQRRAGRRDQPRDAEDAVGAARSDAGRERLGRQDHLQAREPFLVLATQNPLEMEGTYPLPEAQLDRFFFKLKVMYPPEEAMHEILERTTRDADPTVTRVVDGAGDPGDAPRRAVGADRPAGAGVRDPADAGIAPESPYATPLVKKYVRYGASPRAAQALVLAGKIHALNRGQAFVSVDDIRAVALPALRHRLLLNFEGEADEVNTDTIVEELLTGIAP